MTSRSSMLCAAAANAPLSEIGKIGRKKPTIAFNVTPMAPHLERQYLHKRIAEDHAQLERLEKREAKQLAVMLEV